MVKKPLITKLTFTLITISIETVLKINNNNLYIFVKLFNMDVYTVNANDLATYVKRKQKLINLKKLKVSQDDHLSIGKSIYSLYLSLIIYVLNNSNL